MLKVSGKRVSPRTCRVETSTIIEEMVRRIVDRYEPERIILFGSHASGTVGPDSDVDLLIVLPAEGSKQ